ncbi:MAG TPA: 16S rRNA (cytosine(1402)-N(4))-methyltransferase RsmH [Candidatus Woesebacteria bacterium]|jgi:16S rRNA (cytosine1402-N4)-methyltransferase|nr:16S rRNA (cytosine(1402)-N(4))-methyltransferase RsmH [Candidatus Shapirobacteria bacterium]HOR01674.1 16S rRNA (cytosine(1402)-N(4))-methyltransferase RsmH [Candidatus Woesebacteria bacterium]
MNFHHPVLLTEAIDALAVKPDHIYVDATVGHGGHTLEILKKGGIVYGFDLDSDNLNIAINRIKDHNLSKKFFPINQNFVNLSSVVSKKIKSKIDGLIADLGLSQNQQTGINRGFSFNDSQSLDMRLNPKTQTLTAEEIINTYSFEQLFEIFSKLGQELYSKPIALKIIKERQKSPFKDSLRLANIIREYYRERHLKTKIDPATKIFLSLRIAVNQEFQNLSQLLSQSLEVVKPGGHVAIITFHSGEDRLVKQFLNHHQDLVLKQKFIRPSPSEIKFNPLSRSSILRSYKIV